MTVWRSYSPTSLPRRVDRDHLLGGQRAADALGGRAPYDAVLVSNRLHDMGGVELITRIRALDHRHDVPIVMVTGTLDCAIVAAPCRWRG
jgi:DNA-binding response OmpR family regulator